MKKQELINKIREIGTCEDDAHRRTLLTELEDEATKDYDTLDSLQTDNQNLTDANERLREANMQLFLRVGKSNKNEGNEGSEGDENNDTLTYDNLFNEKGELK